MGKRHKKTGSHRTWTQAAWAILTNSYAYGFFNGVIYDGKLKSVCVPGLNCYSCPGAWGSCPIGSLQAVAGSRNFSLSLYVTGFLLLVGSLAGRFVCGFLCPFGLVQDLLYKIPFFKKLRSLPGEKALQKLKYVLLLLFVLLLPALALDAFGQGEPWFCKWVCPSGTLFGGIPLVALNESLQSAAGFLFAWKLFLLAAIVLLSIAVYRPFCRYLCPLGAIYGFLNPLSLHRIRLDEQACTSCGVCRRVCKLDIPIYQNVGSMECIRCGDCVRACPYDALSMGFCTKSGREKAKGPSASKDSLE